MQEYVDEAEVRPYGPGEGYAVNVIPFAGVPAHNKTYAAKQRAMALIEQSKQVQVYKPPEVLETIMPVPEAQFEMLETHGLLDSLRAEGCNVSVEPEVIEVHGQPWRRLRLEAREGPMKAATLRLMESMLPPVPRFSK